jgi:hypothetical protein
MTTSGILFVGLAATAGISSIAFALKHNTTPLSQSNAAANTSSSATPADTVNSSSVDTVIQTSSESPAASSSQEPATPTTSAEITGQATVNNEVIPLTEGTTERSYTDSNGTQHTVTINIDGESTSVSDNSDSTRIHIYSNSSSTSSANPTRGSPRR